MAFRNISVTLTGNADNLQAALRGAGVAVNNFEAETRRNVTRISEQGNALQRTFTGLGRDIEQGFNRSIRGFAIAATGAYAAGRALNAGLREIIGGAVSFDTQMRNVNSISYLSEQQLGALGKQVINLSRQMPQSAATLASGLYDIASSGFQGADGLKVLQASAKAATAGLTDTATSARAITAVLNAYGRGAGDARAVSDVLFQTVNVGVTTFDQLASSIGTVIGLAAQAKIPIADVGSAIATMTLAGVDPAESAISLNQVIQKMLQPTTALATVFKQLGYESGESALKTRGLRGVMEDLRGVVGNSATSWVQMFGDVRAARGALALIANDGQTYTRVTQAMNGATQGAGATQRAFAEQMKAVSAQWALFRNRIQAAAITAGTQLLPVLLDLMRGMQRLGSDAGPPVAAFFHDLAPLFHNLWQVGGNVVDIVRSLVSAFTPLGRVLLGLALAPVVAGLNLLSGALAAVTGFVDEHKGAFIALATVIGALVLPQVLSLSVAFNRMILGPAITLLVAPFLALARAIGLATTAGVGLRAAFTGMFTAAGLGSAAVTGLAVAGAIGMYRLQNAAQHAREEVQRLTAGFNPDNAQAATAYFDRLNSLVGTSVSHFNNLNRFQRGLSRLGLGPGTQDVKNIEAGTHSLQDLGDQTLATYRNANRLGGQLGVLGQTVLDYAAKNNIDLSKPWDQSSDAIKQVMDGVKGLQSQTGLSAGAMKSAIGSDIDAMQALADAVKKTTDATAQGFASSFDVLQQFQPAQAAQTVKTAQQQLTDAQKALTDARTAAGDKGSKAAQKLADYEAQLQTKKHISIAQEQRLRDLRAASSADPNSKQLADATDKVAEATRNLAKARRDAKNTGDLSTIYQNDLTSARRFTREIGSAIERGLDPQFVARLLQAGPQQAGPILDAIVSGHSNRMITLVNRSEHALEAISAQAVEMSRLTALAMNATTDKLGHDLPRAMRVAQERAREGAKATVASVAKNLHLSPSEVTRIAQEFGITLPKAIQAALNKNPVHVAVASPKPLPGYSTSGTGRPISHAAGGYITGPGTSTSDSIPAWLSTGEFVVQARAVAHYGASTLHALNKMSLPRYAEGGSVGTVPSGGVTVVRVVERPSIMNVKNETNLPGARFDDARALDEFRRRERRRRAIST